jgi:hypothetical protein
LAVFTQIIRILTAVIPRERDAKIRWRPKATSPAADPPPPDAPP